MKKAWLTIGCGIGIIVSAAIAIMKIRQHNAYT